MFSKERFTVNGIVTYQMRSYTVHSCYTIVATYYVNSKRLVLSCGDQRITIQSSVLSILKASGYKSVSHFVMIQMNDAKYSINAASISINYYSFDINCIFTTRDRHS